MDGDPGSIGQAIGAALGKAGGASGAGGGGAFTGGGLPGGAPGRRSGGGGGGGGPAPGAPQDVQPATPEEIQVHQAVPSHVIGAILGEEGSTLAQLAAESGSRMWSSTGSD